MWLNKLIKKFYIYIYFNSVDEPWQCWIFIGGIIVSIILGVIYGHLMIIDYRSGGWIK